MMKNRKNITGIVIIVAAILLFAASLIFQCSKAADGTYMNCHKANIALAAIACVIAIAGGLLLVIKNERTRRILLLLTVISSVISAVVPGILISLCMMPEMTCRSVMRPIAILCSLVICLASLTALPFEKKVRI